MMVNGHPKNQQTFSRVCGYVEQVSLNPNAHLPLLVCNTFQTISWSSGLWLTRVVIVMHSNLG